MKESQQEELKRNREFALIAFHAAHSAADMLEIAQQMQGDAEEDAHEEGCTCIEDAGRLIEDARCLHLRSGMQGDVDERESFAFTVATCACVTSDHWRRAYCFHDSCV